MTKKKEKNATKDLSFEQIMQGLEKIVEQLEQGDQALETSVQLFEEGMSLAKAGMQRLDDAESKVNILVQQDGEVKEEPFEP